MSCGKIGNVLENDSTRKIDQSLLELDLNLITLMISIE